MPNRINPEDVARQAGVDDDDARDVLEWLVRNGWLRKEYVEWNVTEEGGVELPDDI